MWVEPTAELTRSLRARWGVPRPLRHGGWHRCLCWTVRGLPCDYCSTERRKAWWRASRMRSRQRLGERMWLLLFELWRPAGFEEGLAHVV